MEKSLQQFPHLKFGKRVGGAVLSTRISIEMCVPIVSTSSPASRGDTGVTQCQPSTQHMVEPQQVRLSFVIQQFHYNYTAIVALL